MATSNVLSSKPKTETVHTGIDRPETEKMAEALSHALADSFTLYLKTLGVHWNVVGPTFYGLHKLTEEQYEDLEQAVDGIAERIRALGHIAPASFGDYKNLSVVSCDTTMQAAEDMLQSLIADNEQLAKRFREFALLADEADDVFTADMLTARIGRHEENAWMLRALTA